MTVSAFATPRPVGMLKPVFDSNAADSWAALVHEFTYSDQPPEGFPTEDELILVVQDEEDSYEGSIRFWWERGGQLFEFACSHCSCNSYSEETSAFLKPAAVTAEYLEKMKPPWLAGYPQASQRDDVMVAWDRMLSVAASHPNPEPKEPK